ncbi:TVP38/TMEM64 family protein [Alkalihalobacterium alkalinitrilicum]|uniref:TVP38/TMEM64 family protein n=1 Tax=Alkalihalobacterium alkalinitrilicum TaxID=427920 RepID=UPI000995153F|nr:VTT domain-containing protein [Alkalihalobacterium alkalinitrilicum]
MLKKIGALALYVIIGLLLYLYGDSLVTWLNMYARDFILLTMIVATLLSLFPIIPYPIIGGIVGAAFGPALGAFVIWVGSSAASIIMFLVVRYSFQDWGNAILRNYKPLEKITVLFEKNAFFVIFLTRLIPIIPSIIVNIYSALSRVSFMNYAIASSLGKMPSMLLFAIVGNTLVTNPRDLIIILLLYILFVVIVFGCFKLWKKRVLPN